MDEMTKRLIKEAAKKSGKGEFFHSSGYAKVQVGEHMGAASMQSFRQRQKMKREFVGKYDDAQITRQALSRQAAGRARTGGENTGVAAGGEARAFGEKNRTTAASEVKKFDPKGRSVV